MQTDGRFYAYVRLLVCTYHCRHRSAFDGSPADLFAECSTESTPEKQHKTFLSMAQKAIWQRTTGEDQCIPGWSALYLHWKRATWVMKVWSQATHSTLTVPDLREHGWSVDEQGIAAVTWHTPESLTAVQGLIDSQLDDAAKQGAQHNAASVKNLARTAL